MNRQDLRLPTGLLVDAGGNVVKVYRDRVDVDEIVADASAIEVSPAERLARALPFPGTFYSGLPLRNYLPYGSELLDNGLERCRRDRRSSGRRRRTPVRPRCIDSARCSPGAARPPRPARRSSRRSPSSPISPRPTTISAHCSRRGRSRRGDRPVPGGAGVDPRVSGRVEQSWLCAAAHGPRPGGPRAVREGAGAAARFPRSAQQSGSARSAAPATWTARSAISVMRSARRATTGRPPTTSRWSSRRAGKRTRR